MPARLLAYGGTSFSERRRIGAWPGVPEATLRDGYGLQANAWCYGFGVLAKQPFLIFRQRQNVENRGGYPFSLLLDPGEAVWERFEWNAAALAAALIEADPDVLFRTPESCSADALDRLLSNTTFQVAPASCSPLSYLVVASTAVPDPITVGEARPEPATFAASLAAVPICFRAGGGWLMGGGASHGRALGANLVVDPQSKGAPDVFVDAGGRLLTAWSAARKRGLVEAHESKPAWMWEDEPASYLDAIVLLHDLETAESATDELIARAAKATALQDEVGEAAAELMTRGSGPIGQKASEILVGLVLKGKRKIDASVAERLHPDAVLAELRRYGSPPKKIPRQLPVSRDMKVGLWLEYLEQLGDDVRGNLAEALKQLGLDRDPEERRALVQAALAALPGSEERLANWKVFRKDPETWELLQAPLRDEALRRFRRNQKGGAEAYLLLGDDPGGAYANKVLTEPDEAARLASAILALQKDYPEEARQWAGALKRPSETRTIGRNRDEILELRNALRTVLFDSDPESVDERCASLRAKYGKFTLADTRATLDAMIDENCEPGGGRFAEAFAGKYLALGDALQFLSERSQDRLMDCLTANQTSFATLAARDLSHGLNNASSRNAYTRALSRLVLRDRALCKRVATELSELPMELEGKLKRRMLTQRDARA